MSKIVLTNTNGGYNISVINDNFEEVVDTLQNKVLYRDNPTGEPNNMESDLDMDGHRVYNLPIPTLPSEAARLQDVINATSGILPASAIPFTPYLDINSTNVQGAIQEVKDDIISTSVSSAAAVSALSTRVESLDDETSVFSLIDGGVYPSTTLEYKSESSLVVTPSGKTLAIYRIGADHVNGASNITSYLVSKSYNKDTSAWGDLQTIDFQSGFDTRNQIAGVSKTTGRLFCCYVQNEYDGLGEVVPTTRKTYLKYSDNDGVTWSSRINISQYCAYPSLDNVPFGNIITFDNGDLMISLYNYHTIITLRSTNNGLTWGTTSGSLPNPNPNLKTVYTTSVTSDDNLTEPTIVKVSNTNLVCLARCIPTGKVADDTVIWDYQGRAWSATTAYEVDRVVYVGGRVYRCTVEGTSSGVAPSHGAGSASDGTATWLYVGAYSAWAATTAVTAGSYRETYSSYLYLCSVSGTTGATAPFYSTLDGNETQIGYFKSDDGGNTWSAPKKVTWTSGTFKSTSSPPAAIVVGSTVHICWAARSYEWAVYHVKMQARAFFENPDWAFSKSDGEPRSRIMRSFLSAVPNSFDWRIDYGYVSRDVIASWYDKPVLSIGKTSLYSTVIHG